MSLRRTAWWPHATRVDRSGAYPGMTLKTAQIVVLHSTEGHGPAGYNGGASAPHFEYWPKKRTWRQFFPVTMSSRALANAPKGVETNRDPRGVIQVEIVGTSGWSPAHGIHVSPLMSDLTDDQLGDIAALLAWLAAEHGTPLLAPYRFRPWNDSSGRMSAEAWTKLRGGIVGHSHVPENDHTDPGEIDIATILTYARGDDMPITKADAALIATAVLDAYTTKRGQTLLAQAAQLSLSNWSKVPQSLATISARVGAPVDPAQIAAAVIAGITPTVRDAVKAAVEAGGTPDAVADRVLDRLGQALTDGAAS